MVRLLRGDVYRDHGSPLQDRPWCIVKNQVPTEGVTGRARRFLTERRETGTHGDRTFKRTSVESIFEFHKNSNVQNELGSWSEGVRFRCGAWWDEITEQCGSSVTSEVRELFGQVVVPGGLSEGPASETTRKGPNHYPKK